MSSRAIQSGQRRAMRSAIRRAASEYSRIRRSRAGCEGAAKFCTNERNYTYRSSFRSLSLRAFTLDFWVGYYTPQGSFLLQLYRIAVVVLRRTMWGRRGDVARDPEDDLLLVEAAIEDREPGRGVREIAAIDHREVGEQIPRLLDREDDAGMEVDARLRSQRHPGRGIETAPLDRNCVANAEPRTTTSVRHVKQRARLDRHLRQLRT